jgi:hypothetical protein
MKRNLIIILFFTVVSSYAQLNTVDGEVKTEILKGSEQQMMSECGAGKTSIEQNITINYGRNGSANTYGVKTLLWFSFADAEGRSCYGNWRYDLMSVNKEKLTLTELKKEKERQTKKAFELLNHLQREGNH